MSSSSRAQGFNNPLASGNAGGTWLPQSDLQAPSAFQPPWASSVLGDSTTSHGLTSSPALPPFTGSQLPQGQADAHAQVAAPAPVAPMINSNPAPPGAAVSNRRAKYAHLDWGGHKEILYDLYMRQNLTLPETKLIMESGQYNFHASTKLYKDKFDEWDWRKKLTADTAKVLEAKARRRRLEEDKDTVFNFGGKVWDVNRVQNTVARAKKTKITDEEAEMAPTPAGVSYETPTALAISPADQVAPSVEGGAESDDDAMDTSDDDEIEVTGSRATYGGPRLALVWKGHSISQLRDMWQQALNLRNSNNVAEAERMLSFVSQALRELLGATNEDTIKVSFNYADLLADSGRVDDAMLVVQEVVQNHMARCGPEDKQTQSVVLQAAEHLNAWHREEEALGLLSLSREILNASRVKERNDKKGNGKETPRPSTTTPGWAPSHQPTPASVNIGLDEARNRVAAGDEAAEGLLRALISQCEHVPGLDLQQLRARGELIKLYVKKGRVMDYYDVTRNGLDFLNVVWNGHEWESDEIKDFDFLEVVLQVLANVLQAGRQTEAGNAFGRAADKAAEVFGVDDERTVWVLISIGLAYQTHVSWYSAENWFDRAYAAALRNRNWGPKDGIVKSLENAQEHRHFSYTSDDGRPFKTIFGVTGIVIRPGRLHLE